MAAFFVGGSSPRYKKEHHLRNPHWASKIPFTFEERTVSGALKDGMSLEAAF